jgi:glutathione S-transferase
MKILTNTTSPYARIARIALAEKGYDLDDTELVNPWADAPQLLATNPSVRVPTLVTPEGLPITESLLTVMWLEAKQPKPSLLSGPLDQIISQAGVAMGVIDAMANIVTGYMQIDPNFAESKVGLKRRRTTINGFRAMEAHVPAYTGGTPNIAVITTIVALDYLRLRFASEPWIEPLPKLDALLAKVADRPAYNNTKPYIPK